MRFFVVKNEQTCRGCSCTMFPGEFAIVIRIREIPYTFHTGCFLEWNKNMFHYRLQQWEQSRTEEPRVKHGRGRPRKYINPTEAHNARNMMRYYLKKGNPAKVEEFQVRLSELRA